MVDSASWSDAQERVPAQAEIRMAAMVHDHFVFVWQFLRRLGLAEPDADDATQSAFLIASQKLEAIEYGFERSFLYSVARRLAANARTKSRREKRAMALESASAPGQQPGPDEEYDRRRARDWLDSALQRVPLELRVVYILAEIENLSTGEIAVLQGMSRGTVASRLRRARMKLSEQMAASTGRVETGKGEAP